MADESLDPKKVGRIRALLKKHGRGATTPLGQGGNILMKGVFLHGLGATAKDLITHPEEEGGLSGAAERALAGWGPLVATEGTAALARRALPKIAARQIGKVGAKKLALAATSRVLGGAAMLSNPVVGTLAMFSPVLVPMAWDAVSSSLRKKKTNELGGLSPREMSLLKTEMYKQSLAQRAKRLSGYDYSLYGEEEE